MHLEGLTNLSTLDLDGTRVGNAGFVYLRGLSKLSALDLNNTQVRDAGLTYLKGLANLSTLTSAARRSATPGSRIWRG